jgi:mevalonate kinase
LTRAHAPGKVILFGEHAVVYGRPAIAVAVTDVRAEVIVEETRASPGVTLHAGDIGRTIDVADAPDDEPLSLTVRNALARLDTDPADVRLSLAIRSSIPVASGLGSGAAVAAAIVRAFCAHLDRPLDDAAISALVYQTEVIHHGTPSGIDNTVVVYERPVYFRKGQPIETFSVQRPFWLAIADTGLPSLTKVTVGDVRAAWQADPARYEALFDRIGAVADAGRAAIEAGEIAALGPLMERNQRLLRQLDVSSPELEAMIDAARRAGAPGAKLSGGGRGGNAIALIAPENAEQVQRALLAAGAARVIVTQVGE